MLPWLKIPSICPTCLRCRTATTGPQNTFPLYLSPLPFSQWAAFTMPWISPATDSCSDIVKSCPESVFKWWISAHCHRPWNVCVCAGVIIHSGQGGARLVFRKAWIDPITSVFLLILSFGDYMSTLCFHLHTVPFYVIKISLNMCLHIGITDLNVVI